eukprot:TRINITY_DN10216_c0_g1_i1.p1 TRINITY_DN10216_c0_g1~~TRINITY_DN10216_c0_g1_i1.p1  ORF type:complete len:155 (-),score=34.49 TRINITY_DN10216_c0_g1_i1:70-534(-)
MNSALQRLQKELMVMMQSNDSSISAFPVPGNMFEWKATVQGVDGTAYEGLSFKLKIIFGPEYPYKPPTVTFLTPCFHPNVDVEGNICLDILKTGSEGQWSAIYNVYSVLLSIQSLLGEPNNDDPFDLIAAGMWCNQPDFKVEVLRKHALAEYEG